MTRRSRSRLRISCRKPLPLTPTRQVSGTVTSSRKISHESLVYQTIFSSGLVETPGASIGTRYIEMALRESSPRSELLAITSRYLASSAFVIRVLVPLNVTIPVSYTHLRAHETRHDLVCRLL